MLKIEKILDIKPYTIVCKFNNGIEKKINVTPLIQLHSHLEGIEKLKDELIFNSAKIGIFGELYWENIITGDDNTLWNYDISPEFIFYQ